MNGAVGGVSENIGSISGFQRIKVGVAYQTDDAAAVMDGGTVGADATITPAATDTSLYLGNHASSTRALNGYIYSITYLPRRMTNAELIARTS
tara:strand:- start:294 stop:572 length:279 start_codon:yes stop_codon:yes gene_type:complete